MFNSLSPEREPMKEEIDILMKVGYLIEKYESYLHIWNLMNKNKLRYKFDSTNKYYMKR